MRAGLFQIQSQIQLRYSYVYVHDVNAKQILSNILNITGSNKIIPERKTGEKNKTDRFIPSYNVWNMCHIAI